MEGPLRMCLACRARRGQRELVRLVAVDGTVTVDPLARRPGRGAYVCADASCVAVLERRGAVALARALRVAPAAVRVDGEALSAAVHQETTAAGRAQSAPA